MSSCLQRILVTTVLVVTVAAPYGDCGACPRHGTTPGYAGGGGGDEDDERPLLDGRHNLTEIYDTLAKLDKHNYTLERRLQLLELALECDEIGVNWIYNAIRKRYAPYVEQDASTERIQLLKLAKQFDGYAALPRASGHFRVYHGRFTQLTRVVLYRNVTSKSVNNILTVAGHFRFYNVTYLYRNYELEINGERVEGSVSGGFDWLETRTIASWVTAPRCQIIFAYSSLYDRYNCVANLTGLGEHEYLKVELQTTVCVHLQKTLRQVLHYTMLANWERAVKESDMCNHKSFKDVFAAVYYNFSANAQTTNCAPTIYAYP